jgi:hypothetical protein
MWKKIKIFEKVEERKRAGRQKEENKWRGPFVLRK